jgi:tRNA(fMet)-specific endonuclease VapC
MLLTFHSAQEYSTPLLVLSGVEYASVSFSVLHTQLCEALRSGRPRLVAELRYGATKKASPRLTTQMEAVLSALDTLPFESPGDEAYGLIRAQLEVARTPIGGNDMLIAAQAVTLDYTLVTDNESEFSRVSGLRIENWLRR